MHVHEASGYSARYGPSHPETLVRRAAERGIERLALTDRDTVTERFAKACADHGVRPIFGVDLAVAAAASQPTAERVPRYAAEPMSSSRPSASRCSIGTRRAGPGCAAWCITCGVILITLIARGLAMPAVVPWARLPH